jgi:hypothetical protein
LDKIGGMDAAERLRTQVAAQARRFPGVPLPTDQQLAVVLHALADHTALVAALNFDRSGAWPDATSVGRFLHAWGDRFEDEAASQPPALSFYEAFAVAQVLDVENLRAAFRDPRGVPDADLVGEARRRLLDLGLLAETDLGLTVTPEGRRAYAAFVNGAAPR